MKVTKNGTTVLESKLFDDIDEITAFLKSKGFNPSELELNLYFPNTNKVPDSLEFSKSRSLMIFKSVKAIYNYNKMVEASVDPLTGQYIYQYQEINSLW